jgi:hypothetical protein
LIFGVRVFVLEGFIECRGLRLRAWESVCDMYDFSGPMSEGIAHVVAYRVPHVAGAGK